MDRKYVVRTMMFFMVPTTCAIVFTILAGLVISYITSTFMSVLVPTATLLNVSTISIVIFTAALVIFICAMYLIVIVSAIIELKARIHYQKTMREHREIELEKHRQELRLLSRRRIITFHHPSHPSM